MKVAPSVLTADFGQLTQELRTIETADYIHLDIMDGHFVPNISFGPAIARTIGTKTPLPLDVHLMVTDPGRWIDDFAFDNTRFITVHIEAEGVKESFERIRKRKIGVGLSVKPKTDVTSIVPLLPEVDLVLVMTVEPGFGGQSFMPDMVEKIRSLKRIREEEDLSFLIEVDGGIDDSNIDLLEEAGVDIVVAGSYVFNSKDRASAIGSLK
ncbi:MAG: ribulose-phosphate 3-epimerase [Acholeplasmataceae bacterium]